MADFPSDVGTGHDYSTLSLWEDAVDHVASSGNNYIANCYATGDLQPVTIAGWATGSTCTIRAASGEKHTGKSPTSGAYVNMAGGTSIYINNGAGTNMTVSVQDLGLVGDINGNYGEGVRVGSGVSGTLNLSVSSCVLHYIAAFAAGTATFEACIRIQPTSGLDMTFLATNNVMCIIDDQGNGSTGFAYGIYCVWSAGTRNIIAYNNTYLFYCDASATDPAFQGFSITAFGTAAGTSNVFNNISHVVYDDGAGTNQDSYKLALGGSTTLNSGGNAGNMGTIDATNIIDVSISDDPSTLFADWTNGDFTPTSEDLIGAAITSNMTSTDIVGVTRGSEGDIGAFEYVPPAAGGNPNRARLTPLNRVPVRPYRSRP